MRPEEVDRVVDFHPGSVALTVLVKTEGEFARKIKYVFVNLQQKDAFIKEINKK